MIDHLSLDLTSIPPDIWESCLPGLTPPDIPQRTIDGIHHRLPVRTLSLCLALEKVGIPTISTFTLPDVIYRVTRLQDMGYAFMAAPDEENPLRLHLTWQDIIDHLDLHLRRGPILTIDEFDRFAREKHLSIISKRLAARENRTPPAATA